MHCGFFFTPMTITTGFSLVKMHGNCQSEENDSSDSEDYMFSTMKSHWKRDYENGNFGCDFPSELVKPKLAIDKTVLDSIRKIVRSKQNVNEPIVTNTSEMSAIQFATTTIIGSNLSFLQQNMTSIQSNCGATTMTSSTNTQQQPIQNNVSHFTIGYYVLFFRLFCLVNDFCEIDFVDSKTV